MVSVGRFARLEHAIARVHENIGRKARTSGPSSTIRTAASWLTSCPVMSLRLISLLIPSLVGRLDTYPFRRVTSIPAQQPSMSASSGAISSVNTA
jgi:hypothetical protein